MCVASILYHSGEIQYSKDKREGRIRGGQSKGRINTVSVYQSEELKGTFGLSDGMQNTVTGNRGEGDQVDR